MEIHWKNVEPIAPEIRERVEERLHALAGEHGDLIDVRISAKSTGHHRHGGQEVRITCAARGKEIVAARTRPDASLALNEAMDVFEREIARLRERRSEQREERERGAPPETGVIDQVLADYGFIVTDAGERVYFHRNALQGALDFDGLEEGQRVGLNVEGGEKGLQATVVRPPPAGTV